MVSKAQLKATNKYNQKKYDQIVFRVPKGMREIYINYAKKNGMSLASYIIHLIEKDNMV